jgi:hypothetical protein
MYGTLNFFIFLVIRKTGISKKHGPATELLELEIATLEPTASL